jgi:aminotransferase EvaB
MDWIPVNDLRRSWAARHEWGPLWDEISKSGRYVHGSHHEQFERELAEYLGVLGVAGVASGTDALEIALKAVGCKQGDAVVTVANAGGYSSVAIKRMGAEAIYADVDSETLMMTVDSLEPALNPQVKAVVVTHLYGNSAHMYPIIELCQRRGIYVIEDCAQALGARTSEGMVGSLGDAAAFSFYPTKNLGALGDGGAVASKHSEVLTKALMLRQYGWGAKYRSDLAGGVNSRLDELQAAVLRVGLTHIDNLNADRKLIIREYIKAIDGGSLRIVCGSVPENSSAHLAVVQTRSSAHRERLEYHLNESRINFDRHYPTPDYDQVGLLSSPPSSVNLPNTEQACKAVLTVPCFPDMTADEISRVCDSLSSFREDS